MPFCRGKCDYCAFYSEGNAENLIRPWLDRLKQELEQLAGTGIHTVYLGGGTPTLLNAEMLAELFRVLKKSLPSAETPEFSIECNPESLTEEKAAVLGQYVNRVSLGIQSFDPELRRKIGRHGNPAKIPAAFELLHRYGLRNLGCDLIYGLPGQSAEEWGKELSGALSLGITHLSAYSLSVEEGTPLQKRYTPDAEAENRNAEFEVQTRAVLQEAGLHRYEISNYARQGFECRHNQNIWHGETYLGLGPAACSFDGKDRFTQVSPIRNWLDDAAPETDRIPDPERRAEMLIMGLRTVRGWADGEFERAAGISPEAVNPAGIAELRENGFLREDVFALTGHGLDFWNDAAMTLL